MFAVSNFCTVFRECKSIDEVKEKFKPDELENRLENAKKIFSNRKSGKEIAETGQEPEKFSDFIEERKKKLKQKLNRISLANSLKKDRILSTIQNTTEGNVKPKKHCCNIQ